MVPSDGWVSGVQNRQHPYLRAPRGWHHTPLRPVGGELTRCIPQGPGFRPSLAAPLPALPSPTPPPSLYLASQCVSNDLCSIFKNHFISFKTRPKQWGSDKWSNDKKTFSVFCIFPLSSQN